MSQASQESDSPFASRYTISHPPPRLLAILAALAKGTKRASYRSHGGFHDKNVLRGIVIFASRLDQTKADEVGRFLKKEGWLREVSEGVYAFVPSKADELSRACLQAAAGSGRRTG